MSTRKQVTNALLAIVKAAAPTVSWGAQLRGANKSKEIEGSVTCDSIRYTSEAKDLVFAHATYTIYVVDVNSAEGVDDIADSVFNALNFTNLNNTCIMANVTQVQYGSAKGFPNVGIALITLEAEYQI